MKRFLSCTTLFLLSAMLLTVPSFANMGTIIEINHAQNTAYTSLAKNTVQVGDIVEVELDNGIITFLKVYGVGDGQSKLGPNFSEKFLTDSKNFNLVNEGNKVRKLSLISPVDGSLSADLAEIQQLSENYLEMFTRLNATVNDRVQFESALMESKKQLDQALEKIDKISVSNQKLEEELSSLKTSLINTNLEKEKYMQESKAFRQNLIDLKTKLGQITESTNESLRSAKAKR